MATSKLFFLLAALAPSLYAQTTVTLSTSSNPSVFGAPVVLTATVSPATATGKVTFYDGVTVLGTKSLTSGVAQISTIALPAGSRKLRAYYAGATSNMLTQTVTAAAGGALSAQSPFPLPGVPTSAVVADFNGDGKADFAFPTSGNVPSWWQVDLGASAAVGSIAIWGRTDCCTDRLSDYWVFLSDTPFDPADTPATLQNRVGTFSSHQTSAPLPSTTIAAGGAQGRYLRVQLTNPDYLSLAEVQVFGTGAQAATNLARGKAATQSSVYPFAFAGAAMAVDGNTDGTFSNGSVSSTDQTTAILTVMLGKGDGTFQTPINYATGATSLIAADFNGDGIPDLATIDSASLRSINPSLSILLGVGDGTFRPAVDYSIANDAVEFSGFGPLAAADFDGDGKADILIVNSVRLGRLQVLFGKGDGTFGTLTVYTSLPSSLSAAADLVVADFNGDNQPDAAVAMASVPSIVVLGRGDGTAQTPALSLNLAGAVTRLIAGDFNRDGKTDLAAGVSTLTTGTSVATIQILLGNGDGTFQKTVSYPGTLVTSGDFNGDGFTDLVTVDSFGNTVILLGNGDGTFQQGFAISAGVPLAVADFNGDGRADILTANSDGSASILLGATSVPFNLLAAGGTLQSAAVGTAFAASLQVKVLNNGVPVTGAAVTFTAPTVGASAVLSAPTALTNASGVASVTATANSVAGSYVVRASYQGMMVPFSLSNTGGQPASLTATGGTPQSTGINAPFPIPLEVSVKDASGNPVSGVTVTFAVPTVGATAFLSARAVTNASGVASVIATAGSIAGSYTVTASVGALSASFSLTNIFLMPASITATGGTPQSAPVGTAFPIPLQVTVKDANGNPIRGFAVAFSAPTVGASALLSISSPVTDASGVASVAATANNIAGSYTITATVGLVPGLLPGYKLSTTFSLTNLSGGGANLALGKTATQSSTFPGFPSAAAASAVDGNTDGNFFDGSVTATNLDPSPWWQVDLGASAVVSSLTIWNRTDCCGSRLSDFWIFISDTPFLATDTPATLQNRTGTFASHQAAALIPSTTITTAAQGRYVRVQLSNADYLSLAEVQVFGTGAPAFSNLSQGKQATQSSTLPGSATAVAASAVDGSTDGNFFNGSVTATDLDANPWWQVDLGASATVSSIVIWNRTDCCGSRLSDFWVFLSDTPFLATDTVATLQNRPGTFASHQTTVPSPSANITAGARGRYVRVQLSSANYLSLAEVQVLGTGAPPPSNLALGKAATQSSTLPGAPPAANYRAAASSAVDGRTDGNFFDSSVTATNLEANPWWQVDLGASAAVTSVVIWNRTDCCSARLSDYWVFLSDTPFLATDTPATLQNRTGTFASHQTAAPTPSTTIPAGAQGRYVRVQLSSANYLSLAEVQVFGQ
jgi:hypothetical protein